MLLGEKKKSGQKMVGVGIREIVDALKVIIPAHINTDDIMFVCVGTDRSTGDSLAPLIGTFLERAGYNNVVGTMHNTVNAINLPVVVEGLPNDKIVIAIDACLGQFESIGKVTVSDQPLRPGAGVQKELPQVGNYSIAGVVNVGGFMEYMVLQNTRLSLVFDMAERIFSAIKIRFPLNEGN